ncbi:hypothetical protein ACXYRQ_00690 [Mycoplasma sp. 394]
MYYLRHSWSQTSHNFDNKNFVFLDGEVITKSNYQKNQEYYDSVFFHLKNTTKSLTKFIVVIPDIYLYFFNEEFMYIEKSSKYTLENKKEKERKLKLLQNFLSLISQFKNISIAYELNFSNILVIANAINRNENILDDSEDSQTIQKTLTSTQNVIYEDMLVTKNLDLSKFDPSKNELRDNLILITKKYSEVFNNDDLMLKNISSKINKINKKDKEEITNYLKKTLYAFKSLYNRSIYIHEENESNLSIFETFQVFDDYLYDFRISSNYNHIFKAIIKTFKSKYTTIFDLKKFMVFEKSGYFYLIDKIKLLVKLYCLIPNNIGFILRHLTSNDNSIKPLSQVNYYQILTSYFINQCEQKTFYFHYPIAKIVKITVFNNLFIPYIYNFKITVDSIKKTMIFNTNDIPYKNINAYSIKIK